MKNPKIILSHFFQVYQRWNDGKEVNKDEDGAHHLVPHPHEVFNDEDGNPIEFVNHSEIVNAISDSGEDVGEFIILEIFKTVTTI